MDHRHDESFLREISEEAFHLLPPGKVEILVAHRKKCILGVARGYSKGKRKIFKLKVAYRILFSIVEFPPYF